MRRNKKENRGIWQVGIYLQRQEEVMKGEGGDDNEVVVVFGSAKKYDSIFYKRKYRKEKVGRME
jgi:uncharacterized protein (DUF1330 family)